MKIYQVTQVAFSFFVFHQWHAYISTTKTKILGYEWFEIKDGKGKICANTKEGVIKMNVPKEEWELI